MDVIVGYAVICVNSVNTETAFAVQIPEISQIL